MTDSQDKFILAMWLLFCSRPSKHEPEPDGRYYIGAIDIVVGGVKFENETPKIAFVNDLEQPDPRPQLPFNW